MLTRAGLVLACLFIHVAWYQGLINVFINPIRRFGAALLTMLATVMGLLVLLMFLSMKGLDQLEELFISVSFIFSSPFLYHTARKSKLFYKISPSDFQKLGLHLAAIVVPGLITLIFSLYVMQTNGDQGWDSNAYHLPISGLLLFEGSNNFNPLLGLGTFTILTPYAAHSLGSLFAIIFGSFVYSGLVTWFAVFAFTCFAYGSILEKRVGTNPNRLVLLFPTIVWLIPSVTGQTTHFYVDAFAGVFVATTFILMISILKLENPSKFYWFLCGVMGSAAIAVKSQSLYPVGIVVLIIFVHSILSKSYLKIALVAFPFFILGLIPYFRNYLLFGNPIYPIQFWIFPGRISISELSASVDSFVPEFWGQNLMLRVAFSLLFSPLLVLGRVIASQIGWYDINRSDLAGFSYDTVIGGVGAPAALVFCICILFLGKNVRRFSRFSSAWQGILRNKTEFIALLAILLSYVLIPGSWWIRYNLGVVLFLIFLAFLFLVSKEIKQTFFPFLALPIILSIVCQSVLLGAYSLKYEKTASKSTSANFKPEFGLTQNPILEKISCQRLIFVEPRPTFTSAYWSLGCKEYDWIENPLNYNYVHGDLVVMNSKMFNEFASGFTGKFENTLVHAWFDPEGSFGSHLIIIQSV